MPSESAPDQLLPIREVARLTGVNPVTLRAWERRYGLIVPQRTGKGHRLYSGAQVERIQQILGWLARGVAVSQVRELLDGRPLASTAGDSPWQQRIGELLAAIDSLNERRLDDLFSQAFALYPPETLYQHLLQPLLDTLQQRWSGQPGSALEQAFVQGWLRTRLGTRLAHNRRQHTGAPLLIASLDARRNTPALWMCAWLLGELGLRVEVLDEPLPASELLLACTRLSPIPACLLLHADSCIDTSWLRRQLPLLVREAPCPLRLSGAAARIHAGELEGIPACLSPLELRAAGLLPEPS